MKKYTINGDTHGEIKLEAASYGIRDGYFHFVDENNARVFSMAVGHVITVQREEA